MSTVFSVVISGASGTLCWAVDEPGADGLAGSGKEKEKPFFHPLNQSQWQPLISTGNYCSHQEEL